MAIFDKTDPLAPATLLVVFGILIVCVLVFIEIFIKQNMIAFLGVGSILIFLLGVAFGKSSERNKNKH